MTCLRPIALGLFLVATSFAQPIPETRVAMLNSTGEAPDTFVSELDACFEYFIENSASNGTWVVSWHRAYLKNVDPNEDPQGAAVLAQILANPNYAFLAEPATYTHPAATGPAILDEATITNFLSLPFQNTNDENYVRKFTQPIPNRTTPGAVESQLFEGFSAVWEANVFAPGVSSNRYYKEQLLDPMNPLWGSKVFATHSVLQAAILANGANGTAFVQDPLYTAALDARLLRIAIQSISFRSSHPEFVPVVDPLLMPGLPELPTFPSYIPVLNLSCPASVQPIATLPLSGGGGGPSDVTPYQFHQGWNFVTCIAGAPGSQVKLYAPNGTLLLTRPAKIGRPGTVKFFIPENVLPDGPVKLRIETPWGGAGYNPVTNVTPSWAQSTYAAVTSVPFP